MSSPTSSPTAQPDTTTAHHSPRSMSPPSAPTLDATTTISNITVPATEYGDNNDNADEDATLPDAPADERTQQDAEMKQAVDGGEGNEEESGGAVAVVATAAETTTTTTTAVEPTAPQAPEHSIPLKKDVTLREFLGRMDDYAPIIPDAITHYYLTLAGLPPPPATPPHLARLLALATQKFIADVAADAYQYARIRSGHTTSNTAAANAASAAQGTGAAPAGGSSVPQGNVGGGGGKEEKGQKGVQLGVPRTGFGGGGQGGQGQGRTVLTMEDLGVAVGEYGVNVRRGEFYR